MSGFKLLPAPPGTCPTCATKHEQHLPHNAQSLFYQYRFYSQRGRWPTWKDALEHCSDETKAFWEAELRKVCAWTEPGSEVPDVLPTPDHAIGTVTVRPLKRRERKRGKK